MYDIQRILVAVKNPDARRQPGVEKALHIAKRLGAAVELFHAISTPVYLDVEPLTGRTLEQLKREALQLRQARLEKLAARARRHGQKVQCHVAWDFPPHEAIVRAAIRSGADLIIAECHEGRRLKPWIMHLTDWELLRLSPLPVLLLKNEKRWRGPQILAAVDPSHARAKPARLDNHILGFAQSLRAALEGNLDLLHAYYPSGFGFVVADPAINAGTLADLYEQQRAHARKQFDKFATRARIPPASRHLIDGDPVVAIPHLARKVGADLVVMGAVSRSGLKRVFIGNTAEQVLDALPCDVLVVKPGRMRRRVRRKGRGMRVIAPTPYAVLTA